MVASSERAVCVDRSHVRPHKIRMLSSPRRHEASQDRTHAALHGQPVWTSADRRFCALLRRCRRIWAPQILTTCDGEHDWRPDRWSRRVSRSDVSRMSRLIADPSHSSTEGRSIEIRTERRIWCDREAGHFGAYGCVDCHQKARLQARPAPFRRSSSKPPTTLKPSASADQKPQPPSLHQIPAGFSSRAERFG